MTLVSIYLSVLYGILYGFFEAFGVVYLEIRGFSETSYGLTYIALGLGFVFGAFLLSTLGSEFDSLLSWDPADKESPPARFYMHYVDMSTKNGTRTQPEARLGLAYFGAFVSPLYVPRLSHPPLDPDAKLQLSFPLRMDSSVREHPLDRTVHSRVLVLHVDAPHLHRLCSSLSLPHLETLY